MLVQSNVEVLHATDDRSLRHYLMAWCPTPCMIAQTERQRTLMKKYWVTIWEGPVGYMNFACHVDVTIYTEERSGNSRARFFFDRHNIMEKWSIYAKESIRDIITSNCNAHIYITITTSNIPYTYLGIICLLVLINILCGWILSMFHEMNQVFDFYYVRCIINYTCVTSDYK